MHQQAELVKVSLLLCRGRNSQLMFGICTGGTKHIDTVVRTTEILIIGLWLLNYSVREKNAP